MKKLPRICLCLSLLLAPSCLSEAVRTTDMLGREVTLSAPASRIVALTAADCEILCAIGGEALLAGRGEYCDYPPEVMSLPSVVSGYETNLEQIAALSPDLVLMGSMAQTEEQVQRLTELGIPVAVSDAQNIQGVYTAIRMIGALSGKDAAAQALVREMQSRFAAVAAASAQTGKTVYFEVSPLRWGLWAAGSGTFMDELAALCGVSNAFSDVSGWMAISEEQVLLRDPDFIVTITMYDGAGERPEEEIAGRPGWESLSAVKNGRILSAEANEISRPGPRLMQAAETLMRFFQEEGEEASLDPAA